MIRKSGSRFSKKPAHGLEPGGSHSNNHPKHGCRFPPISRALDASVPLGKAARAAWITHQAHRQQKTRAIRPGFFRAEPYPYQAAGLNSLLALAFSGSTVSVATFCDSSVSSLLQAVNASNCFLA